MILDCRIGQHAARLDIEREGDVYRFRLGADYQQSAHLIEVEPELFSVLIDGRSYEARVEPSSDGVWISMRGERLHVSITDPRQWSPNNTGARSEQRENIIAAMPGKIVRVLVSPGDAVEPGQGVLVVEAMKMQNEMKSRRHGRVVSIPVREGETVSAGAVLAIIE
jgi:biotin carboxyl carrier protein